MNTNKIKENITPGIWGAVLGAAALAIVGFNWGGWVTGNKAKEMAEAAIVGRLVPICVGQYNEDSNKVAKLAELKSTDTWKRADYVTKQGWATMPGAKEANSEVAGDCATKIAS